MSGLNNATQGITLGKPQSRSNIASIEKRPSQGALSQTQEVKKTSSLKRPTSFRDQSANDTHANIKKVTSKLVVRTWL
jgi:hypothetical protein